MSPRPEPPQRALELLRAHIVPVEPEPLELPHALGRVLAQDLHADRPSPACDVSAMDGFAVRLADLAAGRPLPICAEVRIGRPPPALVSGSVVRIVTGGALPDGADAIVRREAVREQHGAILLDPAIAAAIAPGAEIRRQAENGRAGDRILSAGALLDPAAAAAIASFAPATLHVHRRVRLALLITGDELVEPGAPATAWQVRDSNGLALRALFDRPWIDLRLCPRVPDAPDAMRLAVTAALAWADALVLTGGVSMGTRDFVPDVLRACGLDLLFQQLLQRPGKPMLGAIAPGGRPVLALTGNPVSMLITARRIALPAIAQRAGLAPAPAPLTVRLTVPLEPAPGDPTAPTALWCYRPVRLGPAGSASLVPMQGSGDVVALARSDGFVELPPHAAGPGPFPFYGWT